MLNDLDAKFWYCNQSKPQNNYHRLEKFRNYF
jgi:hypothetical protein